VDNQLINQQEQNILSDLGSNQNLQYKHNHTTGFIPSFTTSGSTTYTYDNTTLGYKLTPNRPLLNLDNSNGFIGINNSNPSTDLQISSTRTLPVVIQSTSASFCGISLQDSNTTSSNTVQIRSSNNTLVLRGSNSDTLFVSGGRLGVGKERTNGRLHLYENTLTSPFINFDNSNQILSGSNINEDNHGSYYGRVLCRVEGVGNKWLALYN
jgi:hypothetical protein